MESLIERLNELERQIKTPSFRENKGLSNEVGYYIFDYPAKHEIEVREYIQKLTDRYKEETHGFSICVYDLYDLMIDLLEREGFLELCFEFEQTKGIEEVRTAINELLRMEEDNLNNEILKTIYEQTPQHSVIFLSGVGKCFPILRSHKILNNMHQLIDKQPVIMFFPGSYDGQSLILFDEIKDDNYYRAFKIAN